MCEYRSAEESGTGAPGSPARDPAATRTRATVHATVHATCLVVGESGVLVRGESGAGKSSLALALIERAARRGRFSALLGDDRIRLAVAGGRLVARPHPAVAGRIEVRGHGIVTVDAVEACVVRLVVDLVDHAARLPEPPVDASILGVALPCLRLDGAVRDAGLGPSLVLAELRRVFAVAHAASLRGGVRAP